jgi:hypothetical protein
MDDVLMDRKAMKARLELARRLLKKREGLSGYAENVEAIRRAIAGLEKTLRAVTNAE